MSYARWLVPLLAVVLFPLGCTEPVTVSGEVFVVTEGRENVEMGLVTVKAISSDEMEEHFENRFSESRRLVRESAREAATLLDSVRVLKERSDKLNARIEQARSEVQSVTISSLVASSLGISVEEGENPSLASLLKRAMNENPRGLGFGTEQDSGDIAIAWTDGLIHRESDHQSPTGNIQKRQMGVILDFDGNGWDGDSYYKIKLKDQVGWVEESKLIHIEKEAYERWNKKIERIEKDEQIIKSNIREFQNKIDSIELRYKSVIDSVKYYRSQAFYHNNIPLTLDKSKTGSDGKFKLKINVDSSVYLVAQASRSTGSSKEQYYWMVSVEPNKKDVEVMLSNDNMELLRNRKFALSSADRSELEQTSTTVKEDAISGMSDAKRWQKRIYRSAFPGSSESKPTEQ